MFSPHRELVKLRNAYKKCNFAPCINEIDEEVNPHPFYYYNKCLMFIGARNEFVAATSGLR